MTRQTGDLKISFAIKPASMINQIRSISGILEGVASELDMQANELTSPATISVNFAKNTYYATANMRLLGFTPSDIQNLRLNIELENGSQTNITCNPTSFLAGFNSSKNKPFSLNASMYIPSENISAVTVDQWECNTESRYLSVESSTIDLPSEASSQAVTIFTDRPSWAYSIIQTGNWLTVSQSDNQLMISATGNTGTTDRQATIHISAGGLSETITVTQNVRVNNYYVDKETVKLQSATVGKGIDIILMGDGYTLNEMRKGAGKYEQDMRAAADHFFSVYPVSDFREYFNVYMVVAVSNQAGVSNESTDKYVDTKFESLWEGGNSTYLTCNDDIVFEYIEVIDETVGLRSTSLDDITVIMPVNEDIYAGTCHMYYSEFENDYANSFSICQATVDDRSSRFKGTLVHEAAGHGFAKADDEYVYYPKETIPQPEADLTYEMKKYGWFENVDFYDDIWQTSWKGFAGNPKYPMVETFEGADRYGKGIWRPERTSCMVNNILYFNAPTRWAQVRRIYKIAGFNYSFSQFLLDDKVPEVPTSVRQATDFIPLAPPVIKKLNPNWIIRRE